MGNEHKKFGEDRTCSYGDMLADKQTDRQTDRQTRSSQYFASPTGGEVVKVKFHRSPICGVKKTTFPRLPHLLIV